MLALVAVLTPLAAEGFAQRSAGVRKRKPAATQQRAALVIGNANCGPSMDPLVNALIIAEEKDIAQANVGRMARSTRDPEAGRMLGRYGAFGQNNGLCREQPVWAIRAVGDYGEIFQRNLGIRTPLSINRGLYRLWSKGGILFSPPLG